MAYAARHVLAGRPAAGGGPPPVAGYTAWYDATQIVGQADNTPLAAWPDSSGNGHNLAAGANKPTYYSSTAGKTVNGKPAVWTTFASSGYVASSPVTINQPFTIFCVWGQASSTGNIASLVGQSNNVLLGANGNPYTMLSNSAFVSGGACSYDNVPHVQAGVFNGASSILYLDNVQVASGNPGSVGMAAIEVLGSSYTSWSPNGFCVEAVIYPSALTTPQITSVYNYLKTKWGTP